MRGANKRRASRLPVSLLALRSSLFQDHDYHAPVLRPSLTGLVRGQDALPRVPTPLVSRITSEMTGDCSHRAAGVPAIPCKHQERL